MHDRKSRDANVRWWIGISFFAFFTKKASTTMSMRLVRTFASFVVRPTTSRLEIGKANRSIPRMLLSTSPSSAGALGLDVAGAKVALQTADAVCFDVDSTVIAEEGIDVLAEHLGKYEIVSNLTSSAMQGGMKFQDALAQRLDAMKPSRQQVLDCVAAHPAPLTPGIASVIAKLHDRKTDVYFVSGGFRMMIEPIAATVGVAKDRIFANTILFDEEGDYAGFDANELTSRDMGKPAALQHLKDTFGYQTMVMVGDGATDAQAKPPATAFIGFGGVSIREAVKESADWFITDFNDVLQVLHE